MKIVEKYYNPNGKLINLKNKSKNIDSIIRFKVLKNKAEFPCCDYHGDCTNFAYAEVYPFMMKSSKKKGWNYLCRKHYLQEQKKFNWKLPACLNVEW